MASQVSIVNRALAFLGEPQIISIDDEVERARTMKALWDGVRDSLTSNHRWNFAMKRQELAALVTPPVWGYDREFQLPADNLRLDFIGDVWCWFWPPGEPAAPWAVEGGKILTNISAPLKIRYVSRVVDPGAYPPLFAEALAAKLAAEAATRQTESNPKRQLSTAALKDALTEAKRANAIEKPPEFMPAGSWLMARQRNFTNLNWLRGAWF